MLSSTVAVLFSFLPGNAQGFRFLHILTNSCALCFWRIAILMGVKLYLIVILIGISLMKTICGFFLRILCLYSKVLFLIYESRMSSVEKYSIKMVDIYS